MKVRKNDMNEKLCDIYIDMIRAAIGAMQHGPPERAFVKLCVPVGHGMEFEHAMHTVENQAIDAAKADKSLEVDFTYTHNKQRCKLLLCLAH